MGNENQETTVDLDGMSQEELIAMEDAQVEADEIGVETPIVVPDDGKTLDNDKATEDAGKESGQEEQGTQETASTEEPKADQPTGDDVQVTDDVDDVAKHVSPPSKWAAERARKRELQDELDQANVKAAKADEMATELTTLKGELNAIKESLKGQGITFKDEPDNAFSTEKLAEIRDEYGDELADMMEAASAVIKQKEGVTTTPPAQAEQYSGQEQTAKQETPVDDPDFNKALDENESLGWWRSLYNPSDPNDPKNILWDKAVAQDKILLKDPAYTKLSYVDRFKKVVETVSEEVERNAKSGKGGAGDGSLPPSLSGTGGQSRNDGSMDPVDKVLAADPVKQLEIYNSLSEADRDLVDLALDI